MQKLKVLELFGGIGACSTALKRLNINYEIVDYVEIDKYAVKSFNAIHNTNFEPQDISNWNKELEKAGFCTIHGRVPRAYYEKKFFGFADVAKEVW